MSRRTSLLVVVIALVVAIVRISGTYRVYSETFDEAVHIAAGMELLDKGRFSYEPKHPPLARVAVALGPYLSGIRSQGIPDHWDEGRAIVYLREPMHTLMLARLGILPFLILATMALWAWTRRLAGDAEAAVAVTLFTATPIILAHAGVATTDLALVATFAVLLFVSTLWLERPTRGRSVWLGVAGALTLTAKMSSLAFYGLTVLLVLALRWWWNRAEARESGAPVERLPLSAAHVRSLLITAPVAFLCVWAIYGFQHSTLRGVPFPLTTLIQGVKDLAIHNETGHASYLLGEAYWDGRWRFFLVGLGVKTPLTLLALGLAGAVLLVRKARANRDWRYAVPLLAAAAVLAVSIPARINIGVRHVLPVFLVLALCGGVAALAAWRSAGRGARLALVLLGIAGYASTARAHPDYLAWFNELAGRHPEAVLVDSDLDWGQDLPRLRDTLRARGIDSVTMAYFGSATPVKYGIPVQAKWERGQPVHGWFVVSQTLRSRGTAVLRKRHWTLYPDAFDWLDGTEPVARIGKSLLLYRLP